MPRQINHLAGKHRNQLAIRGWGWLLVLLLAADLSACNLPARGETAGETEIPPTADLSFLATLTQQALDKVIQASTATALPSATTVPLETSAPTDSLPLSGTSEIKFRPGGTSAYFKGEISPGQKLVYTFEAAGGQTLIAGVSSNDQEVYFEILGLEDGSVLVAPSEGSSSIYTTLPGTQAYQISLFSPTENVYFLSVEVPAGLSVGAGQGPVIVDGYIDVLQDFHPSVPTHVRYLLDLDAGTTLNVDLQSEALEDLTLALTGKEDGVPYLRYVVKSDAIQDFPVMVSQPYYLDVYSISGESADFSLIIEIDP
jgi:hypothetical protein